MSGLTSNVLDEKFRIIYRGAKVDTISGKASKVFLLRFPGNYPHVFAAWIYTE